VTEPKNKGAARPEASWEEPTPLGVVGARLLPRFPVAAFPGWLAAQVDECARFTQTPPDLPASVALAVLATAAGGRAVVEVRGSWREQVNLYTVAALPPGARKSAVFTEMTRPVLDAEAAMADSSRASILEADTLRKIARQDADKATREAAGTGSKTERENAQADAIAKAQLAESITVPVVPRLVADDITVEAAASLLAEQGGRLAVLSAEGGIFATLAGRYSSGVPNFEVFLKGHSGDMLRVDRKGRLPEFVPAPALTLGLCVQPEVLRDIAQLPGFRGRGLLARILYSLPPDLVGHRRIGEPGIPEAVREAYEANMRSLVRNLAEWTDPAVLTLTPAAAAVLLDTERAIEPRLDMDTGDLAGIRDWAAKQIGATARIAGLLHLAEYLTAEAGAAQSVSEKTMTAALEVGDYYIAHALAAFDHMGTDPAVEAARVVLRWIERERPDRFTRRQAHMGLSRSRFPKVTDLDAPLVLLEDHGHIRREPEPERRGPGRPPSPAYLVNPALTTETTETTQWP
jgi:replicative DNA helicase